jgi:hypothetical protein
MAVVKAIQICQFGKDLWRAGRKAGGEGHQTDFSPVALNFD